MNCPVCKRKMIEREIWSVTQEGNYYFLLGMLYYCSKCDKSFVNPVGQKTTLKILRRLLNSQPLASLEPLDSLVVTDGGTVVNTKQGRSRQAVHF